MKGGKREEGILKVLNDNSSLSQSGEEGCVEYTLEGPRAACGGEEERIWIFLFFFILVLIWI